MTDTQIQTRLDKLTDEQLVDLIYGNAIGPRSRRLAEANAAHRGITIV